MVGKCIVYFFLTISVLHSHATFTGHNYEFCFRWYVVWSALSYQSKKNKHKHYKVSVISV